MDSGKWDLKPHVNSNKIFPKWLCILVAILID